MSLSFQVLSEEEVLNLLQPGAYDFSVINAEDTISKAGNHMIKLTLSIWDANGRERFVIDYLMAALMYKLKHFCDATGLQDKYNAGEFNAFDCIGKSGKVKLKIEESVGYAPKNAVQDYIVSNDNVPKLVIASKNEEFKDSDIPF